MLEAWIKLAQMDPEIVSKEIGDFVIKTNLENRSTGCVIGLSGGVDSTVTAALINKAYQKHNTISKSGLELVGYLLPSSINNPEDLEDGIKVAEKLGIRYEIVNIENLVEGHRATNPEAFEDKYHKGNMISRIRAGVLSTKAATEKKTIAGTGNKDEDFGIGYYTLFGDGAVHFSPIANLPKRLVKQMAEYLGFEEIANRVPSAGLEPGQTDFGDLGYSYEVVELVSTGREQGSSTYELSRNSQITPLIEKDLNLYGKMFGTTKFSTVEEIIKDIEKRHRSALKKMKIISPPVAQVTLNYPTLLPWEPNRKAYK